MTDSSQQNTATAKDVKAFDPSQYAFIGFFLSLVPVFYMSFKNSKIFKNGEFLRSKMKLFLILFVLLIVANFGLIVWSSYNLTHVFKDSLTRNPQEMFRLYTLGESAVDSTMQKLIPGDIKFYKSIVENSGSIFFALNMLLLFVVVKFTNRNELGEYKAMKSEGLVKTQRLLAPVVLGIATMVILYFGSSILLGFIVKAAL